MSKIILLVAFFSAMVFIGCSENGVANTILPIENEKKESFLSESIGLRYENGEISFANKRSRDGEHPFLKQVSARRTSSNPKGRTVIVEVVLELTKDIEYSLANLNCVNNGSDNFLKLNFQMVATNQSGSQFIPMDNFLSAGDQLVITIVVDNIEQSPFNINFDVISRLMILEYDLSLTSNTNVGLHLRGAVSVNIDWGDGVIKQVWFSGEESSINEVRHTYSTIGKYTVKISGKVEQFGKLWYTAENIAALTAVKSFGDLDIKSFAHAFRDARNLTEVPSYLPSSAANTSQMFGYAVKLNQDIGNWDVSNVTDMSKMFYEANSFNGNISNWDVSNVTNMKQMFYEANSFNGNISNWDVSNVTNMEQMFYEAANFNQDIGDWDVSKVTNMEMMFCEADNFNQDIGRWNVSKVTNMVRMFAFTKKFNQNIGNWDVSSVTNMNRMFGSASVFNQPIDNWDVSKVTDMDGMFSNAFEFDQDIGKWKVANVKSMITMFSSAKKFNQDLSNWILNSAVVSWAFDDDTPLWEQSKKPKFP